MTTTSWFTIATWEGIRLGVSCRFRPHERLRSAEQYARVKREGKRIQTAHFVINYAENNLPYHRLGLVVQKRFWKAVKRNLIKRRVREWFRLHKKEIPPPGKDIVVVAKRGAHKLPTGEIAKELLKIF